MPDSSNVVEFPDYSVAQWLPYERMLRESRSTPAGGCRQRL